MYRTIQGIFLTLFVCGAAWSGETPSAEPSAEMIVFSSLIDDYWQLCSMNPSTLEISQLTKTPYDKRNPQVLQNGEKLIFRTTAGGIAEWTSADRSEKSLSPLPGFIMDPRVSNSGKLLAFARFQSDPKDNTDIYVYSLSEKTLLRITEEAELDYSPAWSPDDNRIAYISGRGARSHFLFIINADGTNRKVLQQNRSDDIAPSFSPDGAWIVFSSSRTQDYEIWRVRPDGVDLQQLTNEPGLDSNPCYSPDGKRIVFNSNREGLLGLWTMDANGTAPKRLTPPSVIAREPQWVRLTRAKP